MGKSYGVGAIIVSHGADGHPGAIESAVAAVPRTARKRLREGMKSARRWLETDHPRAWEELGIRGGGA
jgi:hypothetical protein